jgi:hypothetical protein
MNLKDIANLRLASQQIIGTKFASAKEIVAWMGAMQAQDYAMVKWALGVRLPHSTNKSVEAAMDKGDILRTHVLRPTWHLFAAGDVRWMIQLTAPHIQKLVKGRHADLELTKEVLSKSRKVLEKTLRDGNFSTREELVVAFNQANIATDENRASHLFVAAELDGLICSGVVKKGKLTYALLDERVPQTKVLNRDQALASLAKRYFSSHGPATLDDFTWWSGLPAGDSKRALDMVKPDLSTAAVDLKIFWFAGTDIKLKDSAYLLPAYDEFIISYKDRNATITLENHKRAVSSNGIFRPVIVVNGQTIGIWKRTFKKDEAILETEYFTLPRPALQKLIQVASVRYGKFLDKKIELH